MCLSRYFFHNIIERTNILNNFLVDNVLDFFKNILTFLFSFLVLLSFSSKLSFLFFAILPFYILSLTLFNKTLQSKTEIMQEKSSTNAELLNETILGRLEIKFLGIENEMLQRVEKNLYDFYKKAISRFWYSSKPSIMAQFCSTMGKIALYGYGGYLILNNEMSIGSFVAFSALMINVLGSVGGFVNLNIAYQTGITSLKRTNELIDIEQENSDGEIIKDIEKISVKDLSFSYNKGQENILNNINFSISKGEIVAIAGESGVGKSTLIKLLQLIYTPDSGKIIFDKYISTDINKKSFRQICSNVEQNPFLFSTTIKENIMLGNLDAKEDLFNKIVDDVRVSRFTSKLENGIEYKVEEQGKNLSGGQKQRVVLAREFLKNPKLLFLDEATKGLDNQNIRELFNIIRKDAKDRITIIISHSIDSLNLADRIFFLKDGKIAAIGNHKDLLEMNDNYRNMFKEK
ncbi:MAG: hypothetical protein CR982_01845 [Candidatus Cloacimonadota bacterium]|nr:MAG: hypothetical protein CR982_01845 [Candidatus Cloacimonadota bacterium]PIE79159.1 MAG: hypothetical protein CSA15_04255 [Candidatus Delongbacteria bacterium]